MQYYESRLRLDLNDFSEIREKLEFCEKLGIRNLIIEPIEFLKKIPINIKKKIDNLTDINLFYRINLKTDNFRDLKKKISKLNLIPEIISVETNNPKIHLFGARDSRIDLISFNDLRKLKSLSEGILSLANQNNTFIEFTITPIMSENFHYQSKIFRILYNSINMALNTNVKYIISGDFANKYDLRNPRALISIINTLVGVPMHHVKKAFSKNVISLIDKAKDKADPKIIEKGVKIINNGEGKN